MFSLSYYRSVGSKLLSAGTYKSQSIVKPDLRELFVYYNAQW